MRKENCWERPMDVEELLRMDAIQANDTADITEIQIAMAEMAPRLAREAALLRRRRKNRREAAIMVAVMVPVVIFMLLGASALYYGHDGLIKAMLSIAGILSLMSLATLPLIEKFLPERG